MNAIQLWKPANQADLSQQPMVLMPLEALEQYAMKTEARITQLELTNRQQYNEQQESQYELTQQLVQTAGQVQNLQTQVQQLQPELEQIKAKNNEQKGLLQLAEQENHRQEQQNRLQATRLDIALQNLQLAQQAMAQNQDQNQQLAQRIEALNGRFAVAQINNQDLKQQNAQLQREQVQARLRAIEEARVQQQRAAWRQERNAKIAERKPFEEWHDKVYASANIASGAGFSVGSFFGPVGSIVSGLLAPVVQGIAMGASGRGDAMFEKGEKIRAIDAEIRRLDALLGEATVLTPLYLEPLTRYFEQYLQSS